MDQTSNTPRLNVLGNAARRKRLNARPHIKIDRLHKHQTKVVAKYTYGPEERQRLMDRTNRIADNLQPRDEEPAAPPEGDGENNFAEIPV